MRRRVERQAADLFAEADGHAGRVTLPAVAGRPPYRDDASVGDVSLISSPLVEETKDWLSARALTLGNMLASERAVEYLSGKRYLIIYRVLYVAVIFIGAVVQLTVVWNLADLLNGLMAIPNLISLLALAGVIVAETKKYNSKS